MQENAHLLRYKGSEAIGFIHLTFAYERVDDVWVAECLELGTVTEAEDLDTARRQIAGAVTLQLQEMEGLGHVDGFLSEHGVRVYPIKPPLTTQSAWGLVERELQTV